MMSNLFNIFDPSNNLNLNLNWISSLLNLMFFPMIYWIYNSRYFYFIKLFMNLMYNEMKIIMKNFFNLMNVIFFLSLFFLILINNFMGLFPYIFTSSSHMIFSLSFSLPLWFSLIIFMLYKNLNFMFSHFIPNGTPFILMPFMVMIESISNLIRPLTLSIRLTANMIAGHLLLTLLSSSAISNFYLITIIIILFQMLLLMLEFSVSIIQSYVFTILSILYSKETN